MGFILADCGKYIEDPNITFDDGEPKGQCVCGYKWYEHKLEALPESERASALELQNEAKEI